MVPMQHLKDSNWDELLPPQAQRVKWSGGGQRDRKRDKVCGEGNFTAPVVFARGTDPT